MKMEKAERSETLAFKLQAPVVLNTYSPMKKEKQE
jgi:hypothetical protein